MTSQTTKGGQDARDGRGGEGAKPASMKLPGVRLSHPSRDLLGSLDTKAWINYRPNYLGSGPVLLTILLAQQLADV